ncbi:outer spore coat protein CotE [Desulfolucanica intricata]|uniref:outer spore coat protein CotE n=1 Tax=Desulfolucanica intricata TaxID=1285191 RepID=UPI000833AE4A|nr:outer spore coat protein CotE [Desulfolucanica intricata]
MSEYPTREKNKFSNSYREIITKAVCGTARKNIRLEKNIFLPAAYTPSKILGAKITKFNLHPVITESLSRQHPEIQISGAFEINAWYSFDEGRVTDIARELLDFKETFHINDYDPHTMNEADVRIMITRFPECKNVTLRENKSMSFDIELGLYVEVIGETKLYVRTPDHDDDDS